MSNKPLTEVSRWEDSWASSYAPRALRPWRSYESWRFHRFLQEWVPPQARVIEIGCGGSHWLPYFVRHCGASVSGLDYSPSGVKLARAALHRAGCAGEIAQADLFELTPEPTFDVVWSAGFIEHFTDTSSTIAKMAGFAKPGGLVITEVPNVRGLIGRLHKWADPAVYAQHIRFTLEQFDAAHVEAGLEIAAPARYFCVLNLGVVNCSRIVGSLGSWWNRALEVVQLPTALLAFILPFSLESAALSPYIVGVYRRP